MERIDTGFGTDGLILDDWIEFKIENRFLNVFRNDICSVEMLDDDKCRITLRNGKEFSVDESYEKIMEQL